MRITLIEPAMIKTDDFSDPVIDIAIPLKQ